MTGSAWSSSSEVVKCRIEESSAISKLEGLAWTVEVFSERSSASVFPLELACPWPLLVWFARKGIDDTSFKRNSAIS